MNSKRALTAILIALVSSSCGSGVTRFPPTAGVSFNMKLASENSVTQSIARDRSGRVIVSSPASGLSSLQLFVKSVAICLNLTVSDNGFGSGLACGVLYRGPAGLDQTDPSTDQSGLAAQARLTTSNYTDLMNDSSRQALGQSAGGTAVGAGSYNWGYIEWAPPIKVAATLFDTSSGNAAFYTQDGTTTGMNNGDGYTYTTASSGLFTTGPAQTAVILEPNAGSWFRLLSPFTIQQADVEAQTSFVIDLVFDPDGFVTGADSQVDGSVLSDSGTDSIQVPTPEFLPIEHAPGQTVMKESYVASDTTNGFDVHLDLYYSQADPAKTVQAAAIRAVPNTEATSPIEGALSQVAFIEQNPDGTTDFFDYANNPILTGLTRGTGGSVSVACQGAAPTTSFNPSACSGQGTLSESLGTPTTASLN